MKTNYKITKDAILNHLIVNNKITTKNLKYGYNIQYLYNILNDIVTKDDIPKCIICNKPSKFNTLKTGYNKTCNDKSCIKKAQDLVLKEKYKGLTEKDCIKNNKIIPTIHRILGYSPEDLYKYHNKVSTPICIKCNKPYEFRTFAKGYIRKCKCKLSSSLSSKPKIIDYEKREKKTIETSLKKYNVTNISKLESTKNKIKNTKLKKYNDSSYNNSNKRQLTNLENYGDLNYINTKDFKEKSNNTKLSRYGEGTLDNIKIKNFNSLTKDIIIKKFINNKDLDRSSFKEYYNCSDSFMYNTLKDLNIEYKKIKGNKEKEINKEFNNIFTVNDRTLITPYELDLYSKEFKFAIEYNGLMYHSYGKSKYSMFNNADKEDKNRHLNKTILAEDKGIQLFSIFENEYLDETKKDIWISMINDKLHKNIKIAARKCTIDEVPSNEAKEFLRNNHLQGSVSSKINIGLYYDNRDFYPELVALMTFSKSRFSKKYEYELLRFCNKKGHSVQGGASRLLKAFERRYSPKSLVSYANRRWSTGNLYKTIGFEYSHSSSPNYFYFKTGSLLLESRNKYQKHKLYKELELFDESLTEQQNMFNNGYRRIYDSGNHVFFKIY